MGSAATSLKLLKVFDPNELANAQGGGGNCFLSPIQPQGRSRCTEVRGAHVTSKFPRFISPENLQAQSFCHLDFGSIVPFTPWSLTILANKSHNLSMLLMPLRASAQKKCLATTSSKLVQQLYNTDEFNFVQLQLISKSGDYLQIQMETGKSHLSRSELVWSMTPLLESDQYDFILINTFQNKQTDATTII